MPVIGGHVQKGRSMRLRASFTSPQLLAVLMLTNDTPQC